MRFRRDVFAALWQPLENVFLLQDGATCHSAPDTVTLYYRIFSCNRYLNPHIVRSLELGLQQCWLKISKNDE